MYLIDAVAQPALGGDALVYEIYKLFRLHIDLAVSILLPLMSRPKVIVHSVVIWDCAAARVRRMAS